MMNIHLYTGHTIIMPKNQLNLGPVPIQDLLTLGRPTCRSGSFFPDLDQPAAHRRPAGLEHFPVELLIQLVTALD